jgi:diamine N-acetyltransferase
MDTMTITLRRAADGDAAALALVGAATFLESFAGEIHGADIVAHAGRAHAPKVYATYLADPDAALWLATVEPGGAPVGYVLLTRPDLPVEPVGPDDWEVKRIYALSRFHGSGLGQRMMDVALEEARVRGAARVLLGTGKFNTRAVAFYRRNGFEVIGDRWFSVGANRYDDYVMARPA